MLAWDVNPGPSGSQILYLTAADDALFFVANDSQIGKELFRYRPPMFHDSFNSGDTSAWSLTSP